MPLAGASPPRVFTLSTLFPPRTCARCGLRSYTELSRRHTKEPDLVASRDVASRRGFARRYNSQVFARPIRLVSARSSSQSSRRNASTYASTTAVHTTKEIPSANLELYRALDRLRKRASIYVDTSRLALALRSLESSRPVVRIAILGLDRQRSARQLARLLLSDALDGKSQWEENLMKFDDEDSRGLLLRFGNESDEVSRPGLPSAINIPSRVLQKRNLEILISSLNITPGMPSLGSTNADSLIKAAMLPSTEIRRSTGQGQSFLTFPVHRAIVIADGLEGLFTLGKYNLLIGSEDNTSQSPFRAVVNLLAIPGTLKATYHSPAVSLLDLQQAAAALDAFRQSNSNAHTYEDGWFESGMPALTSWFTSACPENDSPAGPPPAVTELISTLLSDTSNAILREDEARAETLAVQSASAYYKQPLSDAISAWSKLAHEELRDNLDSAFASTKWARLKWYKLIWRVDDVAMIATDVLQLSWLIEAEKGVIWLSGRAGEAGFLDATLEPLPLPDAVERAAMVKETLPPGEMVDLEALSAGNLSYPPNLRQQKPWPVQIHMARVQLQSDTVLPLQALAQALLIQSASIAGLSASLSALFYMSIPGATVYSTGAIAAFGVVWSLRRLQSLWEGAKRAWEEQVRDIGRVALRETEDMARKDILESTRETQADGVEDRRVAREAIEDARKALEDLTKRRD